MTTPTPFYPAWALFLFLALVALLKWKRRRGEAERRISRGLRTYTTAGESRETGDTCQHYESEVSLVA